MYRSWTELPAQLGLSTVLDAMIEFSTEIVPPSAASRPPPTVERAPPLLPVIVELMIVAVLPESFQLMIPRPVRQCCRRSSSR